MDNILLSIFSEIYSFITSKRFGIRHHFSGRRVRKGLCRTAEGLLINADLNGAFNIIRKVFPEFNFQKSEDGIAGRFTPHCSLFTVA
jgi:transposase